jgi:hypothetical protein
MLKILTKGKIPYLNGRLGKNKLKVVLKKNEIIEYN